MSTTRAKVVAKSISYMKVSADEDGDAESLAVEGRIKMAVSDAAVEIAEAHAASSVVKKLLGAVRAGYPLSTAAAVVSRC